MNSLTSKSTRYYVNGFLRETVKETVYQTQIDARSNAPLG